MYSLLDQLSWGLFTLKRVWIILDKRQRNFLFQNNKFKVKEYMT